MTEEFGELLSQVDQLVDKMTAPQQYECLCAFAIAVLISQADPAAAWADFTQDIGKHVLPFGSLLQEHRS